MHHFVPAPVLFLQRAPAEANAFPSSSGQERASSPLLPATRSGVDVDFAFALPGGCGALCRPGVSFIQRSHRAIETKERDTMKARKLILTAGVVVALAGPATPTAAPHARAAWP